MKLADQFKKMITVGTVIFLLVFTLTSCRFTGYKGEYPGLYTVAVNSLLGIKGYHSHGDALLQPIEEDSFGRILFYYYDDTYHGEEWQNAYSYLICQKMDETYVYYYPDYNFIVKEWNGSDIPFSKEEIERFKTINDWGEEVKEEELVKYEITEMKKEPEAKMEQEDFEVLFQKIAEENGRTGDGTMVHPYAVYLTSDTYGRTLYYVSGVHNDVSKEARQFHLAVIFNPDGSYDEKTCVMELTDFYNYQDALKEFKELNGWNRVLVSFIL